MQIRRTVLRRINDNLNNICDQPLTPLDLHDYSNHPLFESPKALLHLSGAQELEQTYRWCEDIKGLSHYDLVLHLIAATQLLLFHMLKTTSKFRKNDLLHILISLKVMVLVDDLDELNEASQKVL